jgi:hypothetical protein
VPALAYLTVANVFIYLNLRYEQSSTRRLIDRCAVSPTRKRGMTSTLACASG